MYKFLFYKIYKYIQKLSCLLITSDAVDSEPMKSIYNWSKKLNLNRHIWEISEDEVAALRAGGEFNEQWYAAEFPDVAKSHLDPALHYLWIGRALGRPAHPNEAGKLSLPVIVPIDLAPTAQTVYKELHDASFPLNAINQRLGSELFDPLSYLLSNPDLTQLGGPEQLARHWVEHGCHEARLGSGVSPYARRKPWCGPKVESKLRVAFYGPISASSGLGVASRGYVAALGQLGIELEVIDVSLALYPDRSGSIPVPAVKPDVLILHVNPDALGNFFKLVGPGILDDTYVIGIWVWELMAFRPEWRDAFGAIDEVWTPSDFATQSVNTCAPKSVMVKTIPHVVSVNDETLPGARREFGIPEESFVFLCTFDVSSALDRKNPISVLEAFCAEFCNDPQVFLVMKFHSSQHDFGRVAEMRRAYEMSNVLFLGSLLSPEALAGLQQSSDCLVSAHRSEGFGLNVAEMMARGKPVVASSYSGNLEFCDATNSVLVPASLCEVPTGTPHYPVGSVWGEPDRAALASAMRRVVDDPLFSAQIGQNAARTIANRFNSSEIASRINVELTRIRELGSTAMEDLDKRRKMAWRHPGSLGSSEFAAGDWPLISVVIPVYNINPDLLSACVNSILAQTYPHWELCLCDDASTNEQTIEYLERLRGADQRIRIRRLTENGGISVATNAAVEMSTGQFLAFVDNDDTIEPDALKCYAEHIIRNPGCDLLYCDEDKIDIQGNYVDHYFKPDWSPEHLESCMYVLHMLTVRKKTFLSLGGYRPEYTGAQDYDLALRIARTGGNIIHVPHLLYHWRMIPGSASAEVDAKPEALSNARRALEDYAMHRYGPDARVEDGMLNGLFRITRGHLARPPVTLVMTTNNATKEVEGRGIINLPSNFLHSIVEKTSYPNYQVIVSSNGDLAGDCRDLLKQIGGREIVYSGSSDHFNFADKANFSILAAGTEIVVLLNDDMEIRDGGWLGALVDQIVKEEVGVVGAHLCYPDGRIQHAGMVIGVNETSAHIYHGQPGETIGYNGYLSIVRNYSAVTGACMATKRSLYEQVGGFDTAFGTDFNDTDYCLKVGRLGYRVVYTPFARLFHFESQTAVRFEQKPEEKSLFLSRWRDLILRDPYFNPNLSDSSITFEPREHIWPRPEVAPPFLFSQS